MGGGRSFGAQRSIAPSKPAAPAGNPAAGNSNAASQPVMPASPGATIPAKAAPAPAAAPTGASRWLGPIAGIAAGIGLAALLSHYGLPEGLGSVLLIVLALVAGVFLVRMLLRGRASAPAPAPLQYSGAGARPGSLNAINEPPVAPVWSNPQHPQPPKATDALAFGVTRNPLPPDFDADAFAQEAKRQFIRLQRAYDHADRAALSAVLTAEMFSEIGRELDERGPNHATEIVSLNAEVLEASTEGDKHWASVRFTGLVREDNAPAANSIDEVWNLTKPVNGTSGWLLAGISQLA